MVAVLSKPKQEWTSEDIASLRGLASQLKDGQATPGQLFPEEAAPSAASPQKRPRKQGRTGHKTKAATPAPPASLLAPRATPAQIEEILQACLDKGIDLDLVLQEAQVSQIEELEAEGVQRLKEWLGRQ